MMKFVCITIAAVIIIYIVKMLLKMKKNSTSKEQILKKINKKNFRSK